MPENNLIVLSFDYPPSSGGISRLCYEIVNGSHELYSSITVIAPDIDDLQCHVQYTNIKLISLPKARILRELYVLFYLWGIRKKDSYRLLCGVWHPEALLALIAGFRKVFILAHGTEFLSGSSIFRAKFWLPVYCRFVLQKSTLTIANSHYTEGLVRNISNKCNISVLTLGVDVAHFRPIVKKKEQTERLKISTVSRLCKFKGHDFILETLEELPLHIRKNIEWHIGGVGPYLKEFKDIIQRSDLVNQIHLHGFIQEEELVSFYNQSDLFILATRETNKSTEVEGFGLAFIEAQACGVPVIGTRTGGISDAVIENNGGWLVAQDDKSHLLEILEYIMYNRSHLVNQGLKARKRVLLEANIVLYCKKLRDIIAY